MENLNPQKKWTLYSWLIISFIFFLLLLKWPLLPNFLDIYYHLSAAQGFERAGGFSAHDFWSYAPLGRTNLYPPLFHFLILAFLKLGLPAIFIARLLEVASFPIFLGVIWLFMRQLFGGRAAFLSVLLSSSLYSFYLASSNFLPATYSFMFGLLSLLALKKHKGVSAAIFLSLCFYAHAQVPWFFILTYALYGFFDRAESRRVIRAVLSGILLSLPIVVYLAANLGSYRPQLAYENFILELNLYILLAALAFKKVFQEKGAHYLLLSLAVSAFAFIFTYPYRYLSGQGLLGWLFLSAIGLERILKQKNAQGAFIAGIIAVFILTCPTLIFERGKKIRLSVFNSTYINLISPEKRVDRPNDYSISSSRFVAELIRIVRQNSGSQDIVFTNLDLAGTMLCSLSGRLDARGMLREVAPAADYDPVVGARIIVWFKDYRGLPDKDLGPLVARYDLKKIAETDIAYVYRNNLALTKEAPAKANVPNRTILFICLLAAGILVWDLKPGTNN